MITNDTLAEAISGLASCIRALNWNNRSCSAAALVENFIAKALVASKAAEANAEQLKQIDGLRKLTADMRELGAQVLATTRSVQAGRASNLVAKQMPQQVSTFGGSSGEFGWTGLDSFGNRVTWKVNPIEALAQQEIGNTETQPSTSTTHDPFAPVFELDGDGASGKLVATITLKPGTVVYLVSATGPRNSAIKYSEAGPKHALVRPLVEIEPES